MGRVLGQDLLAGLSLHVGAQHGEDWNIGNGHRRHPGSKFRNSFGTGQTLPILPLMAG
jgi:hypothetical protein